MLFSKLKIFRDGLSSLGKGLKGFVNRLGGLGNVEIENGVDGFGNGFFSHPYKGGI